MPDPAAQPLSTPIADWDLAVAISRGVVRLVPRGAMRAGGVDDVETALRRLTAGARRVTIDLRHLTAIDDDAARALARCVEHTATVVADLSVVAPAPSVAARLHDAGVPGLRPALRVLSTGSGARPDGCRRSRPGVRVGIDERGHAALLRLSGDPDAAGAPTRPAPPIAGGLVSGRSRPAEPA